MLRMVTDPDEEEPSRAPQPDHAEGVVLSVDVAAALLTVPRSSGSRS